MTRGEVITARLEAARGAAERAIRQAEREKQGSHEQARCLAIAREYHGKAFVLMRQRERMRKEGPA
jgi:hypothetical protein